MSKLRSIFGLFRAAFDEWNKDKAPRLAAALAYYTTFSIAPLLIVVIAISGLVFEREAVTGRLDEQIQGLIGREGADFVQEIIKNSSREEEASIISTVIGIVTLLLGAAGVFGQLKDALNTVWGVPPKPGNGIINMLRTHFVSFGMVLGIGFLLMVSLVVSAILSALGGFVDALMPEMTFVTQTINFLVSFVIITILFAMLYKFLPDVKIEWRDVLTGAALTSLLFTIGKQLLGLYLGNSTVGSTYGAAGSLVIMLLWIYYSAQIFLFGAEFTQVYSARHGSRVQSPVVKVPEPVKEVPPPAEPVKTSPAQIARAVYPQPAPAAPTKPTLRPLFAAISAAIVSFITLLFMKSRSEGGHD